MATRCLIRVLLLVAQAGGVERLLKERAGVVQFHILVAILEVANVAQRKDRLAAIAFAAADGGNRAGRRNGRLGGVADAMFAGCR